MISTPHRWLSLLILGMLFAPAAQAADWPQWLGPNRDGQSAETGSLIDTWTDKGPPVLWSRELGPGFSSIAVTGDTGYTMATDGPHVAVVAFDVATGADRWRVRIGSGYEDRMGGDGPRATPTVDGDQVFTLGPSGELVALDKATGRLLWVTHLAHQLGGEVPKWGYSASPLVADGRVYVDVGGERGHGVVAFSRSDGKVLWKTGGYKAGYSSPVKLTLAGTPQIVFFTAKGAVATRPKDGAVLWEKPWQISYDVSAATPLYVPPSSVFLAAGYGVGGTLYDVSRTGDKLAATPRWSSPKMRNKMATSVLVGDHLYGFDEDRLTAMVAATGEVKWQHEDFGRGTLLAAGNQLVVLGESCRLTVVKADPTRYTALKPPVEVLDSGRCWTIPALSGGVVYVRDLKTMKALRLAAP